MNQKFLDMVKGRKDGADILKALQIVDETKPDQKVLSALQEALQLIDTGMSITDVSKAVLDQSAQSKAAPKPGSNSSSQATLAQGSNGAIQKTQSQPEAIATQSIPEETSQSFEGIMDAVTMADADELPGKIADYTGGAQEKLGGGLQNFVEARYFEKMGEIIQTDEFKNKVLEAIKKRKSQSQSGATK